MYVNNIEVNINPTCPLAFSTGTMVYKTVLQLDSKFTQPGFQFKKNWVKDKGYYAPSLLKLGWCNGYSREYNMSQDEFRFIRNEIDWINNIVEFERNMGNNDDELEDDQ